MGHFERLHLIGRITYYLGWISLLCGGLVQLNIATALFVGMHLAKRNLLEISMMCFVICIASELRARDVAAKDISSLIKKAA